MDGILQEPLVPVVRIYCPTNKWIHVAGVYTGSKSECVCKWRTDGELLQEPFSGNIVNNGSPLTMAFKTSSNIDYFNGKNG
jgi:hypothetical protein